MREIEVVGAVVFKTFTVTVTFDEPRKVIVNDDGEIMGGVVNEIDLMAAEVDPKEVCQFSTVVAAVIPGD